MLSERDKQKIKDEETFITEENEYRKEVKKSLDTLPKTNKVSTFLNSSFGIWLLSTIVIGIFTYCFNQYNLSQKETTQRDKQIHQLDIEIESRISQFWVNLKPFAIKCPGSLDKKISFDTVYIPADTIKILWEVFKNAPATNIKLSYSIYKDYEKRNTISLMTELWELLQEKYKIEPEFADNVVNRDTSKSISLTPIPKDKIKANHQISEIEKAIVFISSDGIFECKDEHKPIPVKALWNSFSSNIIHNRWYIFFAYTDSLFG